jgi:hypothetical protein
LKDLPEAKLHIIGVLCGGFPEAELRAVGSFAFYHDPAHLLPRHDKSPLRPRARRLQNEEKPPSRDFPREAASFMTSDVSLLIFQ